MKNKKNIALIISAIIASLIIGLSFYFYNNKNLVLNERINLEKVGIIGNKEDLVSLSVNPGDTVSGIIDLSGSIKNAYFFEGNIKIKLLDSNQNVLKSGFGTAKTDWMTVEPVSFSSLIDSTELSGPGYILIQKDDPSDGEGGPAKKILIPVFFGNENHNTMSIKLYFTNNILNPDMIDCSLVYPVSRTITDTKAVATATLKELIKGPTEKEKNDGYFGNIPVGTEVNSIKMVGDVLHIDFNEIVVGGGGSCGQVAKFNSLFTTLKQFPTIKDIQMTVNGKGNTEDIFQP